jgi:hypothetical protein
MRSQTKLAAQHNDRRGAVLLIVITMLMLFTVVGLSFVYYANAEAAASKTFRESTDLTRPDVEGELALSYFLAKLIYGEVDDEAGVYNAARGHDLARGIYGAQYQFRVINGTKYVVMGKHRGPYVGTGRLHYLYPAGVPIIAGLDAYGLPNYQYRPDDGFLRDPERIDVVAGAGGVPTPFFRATPSDQMTPFIGGFHAPYTYPDLNSFYLAAVRADGTVLTPSFHREYLFGRLDDPTNPNWLNGIGKYLTLRPRPVDNLTQADVLGAGLPYPLPLDMLTPAQLLALTNLIATLQTQGKLIPYPEDRGGDVKNLTWAPGVNSVWNDSHFIDFGAPVMLSKDGRKFKMLFAPTIIDLDGRVNLNVHGNIQRGGSYAGNQGWVRSEVNLEQIFSATAAEVQNLFLGQGTVPGRYGPNGVPDGPALPVVPTGRWYGPVDFDGMTPGGTLTGPLVLPTRPTTPTGAVSAFPTFPVGYDNSSAAELNNHPALFNYYFPQGDDRIFLPSNMEALLRYGDKGSPALTSDLFRLLPQSLAQPRARGLVTTRSADLLRLPGLTPWIWDPNDPTLPAPGTKYTMASTLSGGFPSGTAIPFPPVTWRTGAGKVTPPVGSEFDTPWRSVPPFGTKLDLSRVLPDYPPIDPIAGVITDTVSFANAQAARQTFARALYNRLLLVTGARDPGTVPGLTAPEIQAARWLAQLSVNIVDYLDNDDYMTPFDWLNNGTEILYGTEVPKLLLNEAYVQLDNDALDPGLVAGAAVPTAGYYQMNVWVEMVNTFRPTPGGAANPNAFPRNNGSAILQTGFGAVYKLDVCQPGAVTLLTTNPANATGDPNFGGATNILSSVTAWGGAPQVLPNPGDAYSGPVGGNVGFFVAGAQAKFLAGRDPALPVTLATPSLSIKRLTTDPAVQPTLVLRRLACPDLAPDPINNPYVTVDYMEALPVNDGRLYTPLALPVGAPPVPAPSTWNTVGRVQPYAADLNLRVAQNPIPWPVAGNPPQPMNTFFRHNGQEAAPPLNATPAQTLQSPFDWLVHLDRPLISPMELLHVSAYRPHLLTHQFVTTTVAGGVVTQKKFRHYARWADNTTRLYRFFEFVRTRDYANGTSQPSRVPGSININTVWEPEILSALLNDSTLGPALYANLMARRSPSALTNGLIGPTDLHLAAAQVPAGYGGLDRPFRSLATGYTPATPAGPTGGQYPNGTGVENTILSPAVLGKGPFAARLLDVPGATHPYMQRQALTKMFNNLTTRSNTFAVYVTVGFFEVRDDSVRPVKLGAEIGRSENRHVRHRMFALVDRSDMRRITLGLIPDNGVGVFAGVEEVVRVPPPFSELGQANLTMTTNAGNKFVVEVGDELVLEPNTANEEIVKVTKTDPANTPPLFYFMSRRNHLMAIDPTTGQPIPITFTFRGNPGPWASYNPRLDKSVVPHFSVID